MHPDLVLQAIETATLVAGVVFGLIQLRQLAIQREVQAGLELLRTLQAPRAAEAQLAIHALPDGLSEEQLRTALGDQFGFVMGMLALLESLGPLIARGHVPIDMYAEQYRRITVISWQKMRPYIERRRRDGWPNLFEWLQWLAERMEERSHLPSNAPAFEQFADWKTAKDYERLSAR
jgi:hypothetical protein